MDCTQIKKGSILYLPVYAKGGLLAMGDFHGVMGDGEVEDCGLEIEGKATVEIDVVKQPGISWLSLIHISGQIYGGIRRPLWSCSQILYPL